MSLPPLALLGAALLFVVSAGEVSAATDVCSLGLKGDGQTDDTVPLQQALAAGNLELDFPAGIYVLGTVELPAHATLHFSPLARLKVETTKIHELDSDESKDDVRPLFLLKGNGIMVDGLNAEGVFEAKGKDARGRARPALNHLIFGVGVADLTFRSLELKSSEKLAKGAATPILLENCRNIVFADSRMENIQHGIEAVRCQNLSVHGNYAIRCNTITTFSRGEGLRHHDNWSRQVTYQCVFRGGSPDPSRKAPRVPLGSADKVIRGLDPKAEGYSPHLAGTYDIQISNNYAEYGRTLAWGNKAREVIFEGNVCRFTTDYAYGVEGCENVTFANNIAINAKSVGIMTMYWGEKVVITGNTVIVRDEPYNPEFGEYPEQNKYWGGLLRFHHGPTSKEDAAAGSRYGAGKVIVSGNLLVNELHDQVRGIKIESGRDVLISGNRIVNGWVSKTGEGDVTISGNEFTSDLPVPHPIVRFGAGGGQGVVKNNTMRFTGGHSTVAAGRQITPDGTDEAEAAKDEEKLQTILPAISNAPGAKSMSLLLVEGNVIQGWTGEAIGLNAVKSEAGPIRFIIRGNSLEGTIKLTGLPQNYRSVVSDNLHLQTLVPVRPVIVAQEPAAK